MIDAILDRARLVEPLLAAEVTGPPDRKKAYASSDLAKAVEAYSLEVAVAETGARYSGCDVTVMAHNNPGFDIRVDRSGRPVRYIEVKGTIGARPTFFLSEGERQYAEDHSDLATLIVVADIDLAAKTHRLLWHDGSIDDAFALTVVQWQGRFPEP